MGPRAGAASAVQSSVLKRRRNPKPQGSRLELGSTTEARPQFGVAGWMRRRLATRRELDRCRRTAVARSTHRHRHAPARQLRRTVPRTSSPRRRREGPVLRKDDALRSIGRGAKALSRR